MQLLTTKTVRLCAAGLLLCLSASTTHAQTDLDGIMLKKNVLCVGGMFSNNSWTDYWEGTFKRDNENLGKVTTNMYAVMGAYGLTNKLNVMFSLPYVTTKASAGTLTGLKGVQDLSLMLKWMPYSFKFGSNDKLTLYGVGRVSLPVTDYVADYLPLSIGMGSKTAGVRVMADYQRGVFFATASAGFTLRSNVEIDRDAYYTTEMHYTNQVDMPDQTGYNVRAGYRSKWLVAEGVFENMTTLGGFDIRKNDMPFPSNEMNMTQAGVNIKYTLQSIRGLELVGGGRYVIAGRNVGQSTTIYGGVFYLMNLKSPKTSRTNQ